MISIYINKDEIRSDSTKLSDVCKNFEDYSVFVNGHAIKHDVELRDGDWIITFQKETKPDSETLKMLLNSRESMEIRNGLNRACVGIAGLGGLGSNIAIMLARSGVNKLIIADYDFVDASNLNRHNYDISDIGMKKTDATVEKIKQVAPYIEVVSHFEKLNEKNIVDIFRECDVVCEAFDVPEQKAMLINTLIEELPETMIVSGSGMAGYGYSNDIETVKRFSNLYVCGDGIREITPELGLFSPRVMICAGHMANKTIEYLINTNKGDE